MSEHFTFWDAVAASHPNAEVRVAQTASKAGSVARDWRNAQDEIARLREENDRLHAIVNKLTDTRSARP